MRNVHQELRARLHEAAEAHEPDRARILARIERGMADSARPGHRAPRPPFVAWTRIVGATAAVAGVLGVGSVAVAPGWTGDEAVNRSIAVSPTPTRSPDAGTGRPPVQLDPAPSTGKPANKSRPTPSRTPASDNPAMPPLPATSDHEDGPVRANGSVDPHSHEYWAQSNVALKTSEKLTALTVELRIALTDGVSSTGAWSTLPEKDLTLTVGEEDGFLVYRWVLREGRTVPQGEFVFAGQYNHARGDRDTQDDRYAISVTADGGQFSVGGDFAGHGRGDDSTKGDS